MVSPDVTRIKCKEQECRQRLLLFFVPYVRGLSRRPGKPVNPQFPGASQGSEATWLPQGFMFETSVLVRGASSVPSASSLHVQAHPSTE